MARKSRPSKKTHSYLGPNGYPAASSTDPGTDPYAYLYAQPPAHTAPVSPTEPAASGNVHGLTLGDHKDPTIPLAPESLTYLPPTQATDGGFLPTQPRQPGVRPKLLNTALATMWFIAFCVVIFAVFLAIELVPETGLLSPRPMTLPDKLLLAVIAAFVLAAFSLPIFLVLAYQRMWAAVMMTLSSAVISFVLVMGQAGVLAVLPLVVALFCFLPGNVRYYRRTAAYRRERKAYRAFVAARAAQR